MIMRRVLAICAAGLLTIAVLPPALGAPESTPTERATFGDSLTFQPVITVIDSDRMTRSGRVRDLSYWRKTADGMKRVGGATILYDDRDRDGEPDDEEIISISQNPA